MTEYLIAFNDEWVPDHTVDELREKSKAVRALVAEMKAAGVLIFTGGLDDAAPVFSVDASSGTPLFTDGPFIESKEVIGGYWMIDVTSKAEAVEWAKRCPAGENEVIEIRQVQEMSDFPVDVQKAAAGFTEMQKGLRRPK